MARPHVELRGVTRIFAATATTGAVAALGPVDLDIAAGELCAVIGPSGCGKSTLMEIVAGLTRPSAGTISLEGRNVDGEIADGVGVVFQEDATFPWLSARDNIAFGLQQSRLPRAEIDARVRHALELMGLSGFADAFPAQLSGGMRQRVCIARTLVQRPRLILLDEPFGALDQQTRLLMGDELVRLWRETGATILLITHSLDEAAMLATRIAVMSARPGRILEIVPTPWGEERGSAVITDPRFGAVAAQLWRLLREESLRSLAGSELRR